MKKILLAFLLLIAACATVTAESTQKIHVATEPAGAACTLSNDFGRTQIDETPGTANVHRSFSPLTISCGRDGASASTTIAAKTRGRAYGNLLLLGIPAAVDAGTGYGYEYEKDKVVLQLGN